MFLCKLSDLYQLGHVDKKRKISADRALRILIEELIYDDWEQQVVISVPRIKAFFSLSPAKQKMLQEFHVIIMKLSITKNWYMTLRKKK